MKAYGKLNLLLRVINKRDDGYHNLQMINTRISLYDDIYISRNDKTDEIKCTNISSFDTSENNLILRVVKQLKKVYNICNNYSIVITKNIPFGTGLGGLSMDVGCVIKYIIQDNDINISEQELINFLYPFGADIPYSLFECPAIAEGIGEIITPIEIKKKKYILIIPDIYISTPLIFKNNKIYNKEITHNELLELVKQKDNYNDLEITTRNIYPELNEQMNDCEKYGKVLMSGSGSSFIIDPYDDIEETFNKLCDKYNKITIIETKEG